MRPKKLAGSGNEIAPAPDPVSGQQPAITGHHTVTPSDMYVSFRVRIGHTIQWIHHNGVV